MSTSMPPSSLRHRLAGAARVALGAPMPAPSATSGMRADAAGARTDANAAGQSASGAAVWNPLSGLGGLSDSGATARPNLSRLYLSTYELIALMRGGIYRRLCELLPKEATRKGWVLEDDSAEAQPLRAIQRRLGVASAFRSADTWGRGLGEARVWLVTKDPRPLNEPLEPSEVKAVYALHVLDVMEVTPASYCRDPENPLYGQPETYYVHPMRPGLTTPPRTPVHASRLLRFYGDPLPPSLQGQVGRYDSTTWASAEAVGQVWWDALRRMDQTSASGAKLAQELSVKVFGISNAFAAAAGDQRNVFQSLLAMISQQASSVQSVLLDKDSTFTRSGASASGFDALSSDARYQLSLLTGIPEALLFGQAPSGLNSDGQSWKDNWYATVEAYQEERYREPLEFLMRCLYSATLGEEPDQWSLSFNLLGSMSQKERAEVEEIQARTDSQRILDGLVSPERIRRSRYGSDGYGFSLQPPNQEEEALEGGGQASPDLHAALAARLAGAPPRLALPAPPEDSSNDVETIEEAMGDDEPALHIDASDLSDDWLSRRFTPPKMGVDAAKKALRWLKEHPDEVTAMRGPDGEPGTGWETARKLAAGKVTGRDLVTIAAWWARHGAQNLTRTIAREHLGKPWRDNGYVASLGWGLQVTGRWAQREVDEARASAAIEDGQLILAGAHMDAVDGAAWIGIPLPAAEHASWQQARGQVQAILGAALEDPGDPPHVTVLYLGQVAPEKRAELVERAKAAIGEMMAETATHGGAASVGTFPSSDGSDGKVPVFLRVHSWAMHELRDRLLASLAHLVSVPQHHRFMAHITLGYVQNLTDEQRGQLAEIEMPEAKWATARLEVRHGRDLLSTIVLDGRRDSGQAS